MDDRFNTIAGWALFAGIIALGSSIVAGEVFHQERPEEMGYPIEGVVEEGAGGEAAAKPIACYMAAADATAGQQVFAKCTACHNADKGGANALGPNLWDVLGEPVGKGKGFAFSDALAKHGGTWDFQTLSDWLASPKKFAPGTKMTFAGLSKPEDRANVIAFLNSHSDAPLPVPAAGPECADGAAAPAAAGASGTLPGATPPTDASSEKPGTGPNNGPQKAEDEPEGAKKPGGGDAEGQPTKQ
jgi:cytochrome c